MKTNIVFSVDQIEELRNKGLLVSNKECRIYVEGKDFVAEYDFGIWYLFNSADDFEYVAMFETFEDLYAYYEAQ